MTDVFYLFSLLKKRSLGSDRRRAVIKEITTQYARLDDEPVKAILDIMRSRGTVACCHPGNHDPHYPKCIFEC